MPSSPFVPFTMPLNSKKPLRNQIDPKKQVIVVPCYNEEKRIDPSRFLTLMQHPQIHLLFVNDGSTDNTIHILKMLQVSSPQRISLLDLQPNRGKAEAVRLGILKGIGEGATTIGYLDSDLAVSPEEYLRLLQTLATEPVQVVLGSRIAILGSKIYRSPFRHYFGRVFATAASVILNMRVYDTQCGAKIFKSSPLLLQALSDPFLSKWAFDVELIGRLYIGRGPNGRLRARDFIEIPLKQWVDVPGSKIRFSHMVKAALDMVRIGWDLRKRRSIGTGYRGENLEQTN